MYSCPDCEDGTLEAKVRELELKEGETAQIVGGRVFISHVGCNNGCSSEVEEATEETAPETAPDARVKCAKTELCSREDRHRGMCNSKLGARPSVDAT